MDENAPTRQPYSRKQWAGMSAIIFFVAPAVFAAVSACVMTPIRLLLNLDIMRPGTPVTMLLAVVCFASALAGTISLCAKIWPNRSATTANPG